MKTLPLVKFNLEMFTVDNNCLIAEASDMENRHLQPFFDESKDIMGFAVDYNGKEIAFLCTGAKYSEDEDHELQYWDYVICGKSRSQYPELSHLTATIFND